MSVIVWDGKTLAADRQATNCDRKITLSKIRRLSDGTLLAWTDGTGEGAAMARWYEEGADPEKLPDFQNDDDNWARLVVVQLSGKFITFEKHGEHFEVLDRFTAFGAGADFAIGAMAMGADARKAVEVASQFSTVCGMGVEAFDLEMR